MAGSFPVTEKMSFSSVSGSEQVAMIKEKGRKKDLMPIQCYHLSKGGEVKDVGAGQ